MKTQATPAASFATALTLIAGLAVAVAAVLVTGAKAAPKASASGETLVYEAEALLESEPATAPLAAQGNCCGVVWSRDAQLFFRAAKVGDSFTVAFGVPEGGSYDVSAFLTRAPDYGTYTLAIDGKRVGAPFDGYGTVVIRTGPMPLGGVGLRKGRHEITLTITGKNPAATRYYAGLDSFMLRRR